MSEPALLILGPARRRRGRRPIYDKPATRRFAMRVTDDQVRDLKEIAAEENRDAAAIVRDAIDEYVADYRERKVFRTSSSGPYKPE